MSTARCAFSAAHARFHLLLGLLLGCLLAIPAIAQNALYEAEAFQSYGGWSLSNETGVSGYLIAPYTFTPPDAQTLINVTTPATYSIWVRCKDYPDYLPGTRRLRIVIDGLELGEVGNHNQDGWYWQLSGGLALQTGQHIVALRSTSGGYARCDAIVLLQSSTDPNTMSTSALAALRRTPVKVPETIPGVFSRSIPMPTVGPALATLDNNQVRMTFHAYTDGANTRIWRRTALNFSNTWVSISGAPTSETLFLLHIPNTSVYYNAMPGWSTPQGVTTVQTANGPFEFRSSGGDPFQPAPAEAIEPTAVRQIDSTTVELDFVTSQAQAITGRWTLKPGDWTAKFSMTLTPKTNGYYSVGFLGLRDYSLAETQYLQLPPLYQMQRLPTRAEMVSQEMMPHPLALQQTLRPGGAAGQTMVSAVIADPSRFTVRWADRSKAIYGFTLRNPRARVQPTIFSPLLGEQASLWTAGTPQTVSWYTLNMPGDWKAGMAYSATNIFKLEDYRKPVHGSLTTAAVNMMDLIMDANASGWSDELKGFWDIEGYSRSKHAAPLAIVAAAMLRQDQTFFAQRALPTIAFTLSRKTASIDRPDSSTLSANLLQIPTSFYSTTYWLGVEKLLGDLNPWLDEFALPNGQVYNNTSYNSSPTWSEELSLYRERPNAGLLAQLKTDANTFINTYVTGRQETPINFSSFYNISFYPYWWDLQDLYDSTGDANYLAAAEEGASNTIAGMWVHPKTTTTETLTIHPGGVVNYPHNIWWKDDVQFRLGFPLQANSTPQKTVPAWQVSRVGLGLEQPSTYWSETEMRNIMMCNWAPHLLRLSAATGKGIYETFARNAIIGRFANYPGYYLCDYTDITQTQEFTTTGPDVSSIYYHHIPPHLSLTLDYIFSQAEIRSGGQVKFPWVKQKNYVWFTNHLFGEQSGTFYGETGGVPWLRKDLLQLDTVNVDWIAARSANRFFVAMVNQLSTTQTVNLTLNQALIGLKPADPYRLYTGSSQTPRVLQNATGPLPVQVPPRGIVGLSLPAARRTLFPAQAPMDAGHWTKTAPDAWGKLHAFRVRSPLGGDGMFACLTGGPADGATVTLTLTNGPAPTVDGHYPYETVAYPWAADQSMALNAQFNWPLYGGTKSLSLNLPGIMANSVQAVAANKIQLELNTAALAASATSLSRYTLSPAVTIKSVAIASNLRTVTLTLNSNLDKTKAYTLTIKNLQEPTGVELAWQQSKVTWGTWAWSQHVQVHFAAAALDKAILTDFPLLIRLRPGEFDFSKAQAGGADLRFQDSAGHDIPHEIEYWNAATGAAVWVRVPRISNENPYSWIGMHYGLGQAWTVPDSAGKVWAEPFSGVWHLNGAAESSPNAQRTLAQGAMTTSGLIGTAMRFDGNDELNVDDDDALNLGTGAFTLSAWIQKQTTSTMIVAAKDFGYLPNRWSYGFGGDQIAFRSNDKYYYTAPRSLKPLTWHHVVFVRSGNTGYSYVDGEPSGGPHDMTGLPALDNNRGFLIGRREYPDNPYYFRGMLDELRVEKTARSSDWVKACYLNQRLNSDFISFGVLKAATDPAWEAY